MSVNSLVNFGVPGLNGDRGAPLMPFLSNRFRLIFYNFGLNGEVAPYDLTRQIKSVNRPTIEFEEIKLYSYVSTVYINGRGEWGTMTVAFHDDITNAVSSRVLNQVAKQMNFYDQTASRAGENYKFEMDLDMLAGGASSGAGSNDANVLQRWSYSGCMIQNIDGGELSYETGNQAAEMKCTIRFDNCVPFNQFGARMATFQHTNEIRNRQGIGSTGIGALGGIGISIGGFSLNNGSGGTSIGTPFGSLGF